MSHELEEALENEYKRIQQEHWMFLHNTYQSNIKKSYNRTKIGNYINIQSVKQEIYNLLGGIPVFIFLTELCSHIKMPCPILNVEKGILLIKLLIEGCSVSNMNIYDENGSFYKVYESLFVKNIDFLENWCNNILDNCFSSNITRLFYSRLYNPPNFEHCTLLLDGKHNKIVIEDINLNKKDLYSYKIKNNALNTQYIIDSAGYAIYVSESLPCKFNNDDTMLINNINITKFFKVTDCLCFDGLYENVIKEVIDKYNNVGLPINEENFCFPIRKPKDSGLSIDEANFNKQLGSYRSSIETFFANFCNTFKRFSHSSNIRITKERTYNVQIKLCLVLYNIMNFVRNNNIEESPYHRLWLDENFDFFNDIEDFNTIKASTKTIFKKENIYNMKNRQTDAISKLISDLKINSGATKNKMDIDIENDKNKKQKSYEIQYIVKHREINGKREYLIKWKGYTKDKNTWESEDKFDTNDILENYWKSLKE